MPENGCLDLTNQRINRTAIKTNSFQVTFSRIKCLKLGFNYLENDGTKLIAEMMASCHNITSVDLGFNGVGDVGACALGSHLSGHRSLETLYLSGNNISYPGCASLSNIIQSSSVLKKLCLSGNKIGALGARELASALKVGKSLISLDISSCGIGSEGFRHIASALPFSSTIRELNLGNNDDGDDGIKCIAQGMTQNRNIELLDVCFNGISATGCKSLAEALSNYLALKSLCIGNNRLEDGAVGAIVHILNSASLIELHIGFNKISAVGILSIVKAIGDIPVGKCHLQKLTLSGNQMNTEGARALASLLGRKGTVAMREIYLDQMNCGQAGNRDIAVSIATNRDCELDVITGVPLGPLMIELGAPAQLVSFSNIQVLLYIKRMWAQCASQSPCTGPGPVPINDDMMEEEHSPNSQLPSVGTIHSDVWSSSGLASACSTASTTTEVLRRRKHSLSAPDTCNRPSSFNSTPQVHSKGGQNSSKHKDIEHSTTGSVKVPKQQLTTVASGGSMDDLADLADEVARSQIKRHLSEVSPSFASMEEMHDSCDHTDSNGSSVGSVPQSPISTSIVTKSTASTAQIDSVSKQLEHMFEPMLQEIASMSFDPSNLWMLHQYYYSPSSPDSATGSQKGSDEEAYHIRGDLGVVECGDSNADGGQGCVHFREKHAPKTSTAMTYGIGGGGVHTTSNTGMGGDWRPAKRRGNMLTMTRIAEYPRIQYRLECLKLVSDQASILTLLRQLRCIEEYIDTYKTKFPVFSLINIETILLDDNGMQKLT